MTAATVSPRLPTETRRAGIVAAAIALAARRSPAAITTTELAGALGLTQGALFKHFPTKDAVWLAVAEWTADTLLPLLEQAQAAQTSPTQGLRAVFLAHMRFIATHPGVPRIVFHELQREDDSPARARVRQMLQSYRRLVEGLVARAVEQGEATPGLDREAMAMLFIGAVQGLVMQSLVAGTPARRGGPAERVIDTLLGALRTQGSRP
jgi:TetR/AcrR family transcriptional regulator